MPYQLAKVINFFLHNSMTTALRESETGQYSSVAHLSSKVGLSPILNAPDKAGINKLNPGTNFAPASAEMRYLARKR